MGKKAYIIEPGSHSKARSWKGRARQIHQIFRRIQRKYPEVVVLDSILFPGTKIINILRIHIPRKLSAKNMEKEFSCGLIEVAYNPKSS